MEDIGLFDSIKEQLHFQIKNCLHFWNDEPKNLYFSHKSVLIRRIWDVDDIVVLFFNQEEQTDKNNKLVTNYFLSIEGAVLLNYNRKKICEH